MEHRQSLMTPQEAVFAGCVIQAALLDTSFYIHTADQQGAGLLMVQQPEESEYFPVSSAWEAGQYIESKLKKL